MKGGGQILLNAVAICETFKTSKQTGKRQCERRFGEPLKGPIITFGAMVEYHQSSPQDQSRIHQFGKKVLPGIFLGYELIAGEFGKEMSLMQTWKIWKRWMHLMFTLKESKQRKY